MLTGKPQIDPERRYTVKETAALLGMCRKILAKYTKSLDIHMEVHTTGKIYYKGSEIQRFYNCTI